MKNHFSFLLACMLFVFGSCNAQQPAAPLYLKDFKFKSYFGTTANDTNTIYCLLGQGFFRTRHSSNAEQVIKEWILKHPAAEVIKISSMPTPDASHPYLSLAYCWLIDHNDTLNNALIKQGCYPGGTMQRPRTWSEMSSDEKSMYGDEKPVITVHVSSKTYDQFIEQIKAAEDYARTHRLGIWANEQDQ